MRKLYRKLADFRRFINKEIKSTHFRNLHSFVKSSKHGFFSYTYKLYGLNKNNKTSYLSDYAQLNKTNRINDSRSIVIHNKILFHRYFEEDQYVPRIIAVNRDNKLYRWNENTTEVINQDLLTTLIMKYINGVIIKPAGGWGGGGITKVDYNNNNNFNFEGEFDSFEQFFNFIESSRKEYVIMPVIKQTGYANEIYTGSLNTIRILTMINPENNNAFIAKAVHRFGTKRSGVVDNFTQGGCSVSINIENGVLGDGAILNNGELNWIEKHPNSGVKFKGKEISNWNSIKEKVLKESQRLYFIPYIGWDIVPMSDSFLILEANSNSDIDLIQIHGGLLDDKDILSFYKYHNII